MACEGASAACAPPDPIGPQGAGVLAASPRAVQTLKITVLSTMLVGGPGVGEWGFAALVEADGRRLLIDTGARPETVLSNAAELGLDLSDVTEYRVLIYRE